jgi:hypothetical protein
MVTPVPRQERDPAPGYLADENGLTRVAEGGLNLDLLGVGEELVEPRTPDDPDVGDRSHAGQATFVPAEEEDSVEAEPEDFFSPDPSLPLDPFSPPFSDDEDDEDEDDESDESPDDEAAVDEVDEPFLLSVR